MKYFGMSDVGLIREENQDSFFCGCNESGEFLAFVCDGIGGGNAGDVASAIAKESIEKLFKEKKICNSEKDNKKWINDCVAFANDAIYQDSLTSRLKHGMGTTLVGILITSKNTYIFHLGDSRVYAIYNDLVCLTEDHNLAADLIKSGEISEEEAFEHPRGKALTNALGIWSQYKVDINIVRKGYRQLLICSDGLHGYVYENVIKNIMREQIDIEERVKLLIESANNNGGFDNVTAILIEGGNPNE